MRLDLAVLLIAVMLVAFPGESEAKRFGSRSSGSSSAMVGHQVGQATSRLTNSDNEATGAKDTSRANASNASAPGPAASSSPEAARRRADKQEEEERLAKLADEERKAAKEREKAEKEQKAALAAMEREQQERAQKAEATQLARLEAEQERARKQWERERLCVIQPVMSDAEIALCKEVWR